MARELEPWQAESVRLHTIHSEAGIQASDGLVHDYIDGIGMLLCRDLPHVVRLKGSQPYGCGLQWGDWLVDALWRRGHPMWVVGMGQAGAAMLQRTGHGGTLIRAPYKDHGPEYAGHLPSKGPVVLVDDVAVTGESFRYMRKWCEDRGLVVVKEVAMVDLRKEEG